MRVIYEPRGRAREYAALACNLYTGCAHGCKYCYAPAVRRMGREQWHAAPSLRKGILTKLAKDAEEMQVAGITDSVLFCFMSDPYGVDVDTTPTREALTILGERGLNADVLTKGGMRAARDFDLLYDYEFGFGSTIVFADDKERAQWEPNAAPINERVEAVKAFDAMGGKTWVSLEPVINPEAALDVIDMLEGHVDLWKVGKINHNQQLESAVDWAKFLRDVTERLQSIGANYYIKKDLRKFGTSQEEVLLGSA